MRRAIIQLSFLLGIVAMGSAGVPNTFTYQGSLKQNGAPVNGTYPVEIRITNAAGTETYWTSGNQMVDITEGLYRVALTSANVDWANRDPYIETRVNNVLLLPREKMTSTPYSFSAQKAETVRNGSIGPASLNVSSFSTSGVGVVPQGGILIFLNSCPAGYAEVTALRNRFPIGSDVGRTSTLVADIPNQSLGAVGHQHAIPHTHTTGNPSSFTNSQDLRTGNNWVSFSNPKLLSGYDAAGTGDNIGMRGLDHAHTTGQPSSTNSGTTDTLPPSLTVLFCQKL